MNTTDFLKVAMYSLDYKALLTTAELYDIDLDEFDLDLGASNLNGIEPSYISNQAFQLLYEKANENVIDALNSLEDDGSIVYGIANGIEYYINCLDSFFCGKYGEIIENEFSGDYTDIAERLLLEWNKYGVSS